MGSSRKVGKQQCPSCAKKGGDTSEDNLVLYEDGSTYCFACGYHTLINGQTRMSYELPLAVRFPETGLSKKALSRKVLERYGVLHVAELNSDGTPQTRPAKEGGHEYVGGNVIGMPYFDIDTGALIACKFRRFGGKKRDFWMEGDTKKVTFFGISAIPSAAKTVILCEGESDTMSMAEVFPEFGVLGVPGADHTEKSIKGSLHVLKTFQRIIIAFDNDEAGGKARDTALALLPPGKTYVANLPSEVKDINELLVADRRDDIKRIIRDAKQVTPKGVVDSDELRNRVLDYLFNRDAARGASTGFASIDKAIGGAAPGKLITIAGGTGSGKSTLAEAIAVNAATISGTKTFFIPLEMTDAQVGARMVQQILREPIASDPYFKVNTIPRLDIERATDLVRDNIKFFDHYGAINIPLLIETCDYAVDAYGVSLIVLDHITAAASGSAGLDWRELDGASSALKQFALRRGVCLIVVSHISRDEGGKNEEEVPKLGAIRGGNGLAQYSDCVLGVGRKRDSNSLTVRTIKVDRMVGKFVEFNLKYERCALIEDGTVTEIEQEEDDEDVWTNEWDTSTENGTVPEHIRGDGSNELPSEITVRAVQPDVPEGVHTGLSTTQPDNSGMQRVLPTGGQNQNETGESFQPRARYTLPIPADSKQGDP